MRINFDNNLPIYLQIVEKIKIDIISGNLKSGSRIDSVRDLALFYKVNPNTMQRALMELESIGLIYTERTNGKFVTEDVSLIKKYKNEYANRVTNEYINSMYSIGYTDDEILKYLGGDKK